MTASFLSLQRSYFCFFGWHVQICVYVSCYTITVPSVQYWIEALPFLAKKEFQEVDLPFHLKQLKKSFKNLWHNGSQDIGIKQRRWVTYERWETNKVSSVTAPGTAQRTFAGCSMREVTPGRVRSTRGKEMELRDQEGQGGRSSQG